MSVRTGIDCFAGIGGFSLAMRNCAIKPILQIEIDEYCRRVLEKNFPKTKRLSDICTVPDAYLRRLRPWIVCGGFPCQDISAAGIGLGITGERSGLWREMWRVIRETRPDWLLIENVPALRTRGSDAVLSALEAIEYTAWPLVVGALHVGAPHIRQRVWIVAHSDRQSRRAGGNQAGRAVVETVAELKKSQGVCLLGNSDSNEVRLQPGWREWSNGTKTFFPAGRGPEQYAGEEPRLCLESDVARAVDGLPDTLDQHRIAALGNAIVPQVAEAILRSILAVERLT
jgi:DNA (cytosine-5)-methyltransferase 1